MKVFLVCEWVHTEEMTDRPQPHIEMNGIFSTEERAIDECLTERHFYGEFILDQSNHETKPWPTKNEFPKRKEHILKRGESKTVCIFDEALTTEAG